MNALAAFLCLLPLSAWSQTRVTDDAMVTGAMGVGTQIPRGALEAAMQPSDAYGLKVSSPDGTGLFLLDRQGKSGIGLTPGNPRLDVSGTANIGQVGLELRAGNSTAAVSSAQVAFGDAAGVYRHNIRSRATGTQNERESLDFYLWTSSDAASDLGSSFAMSLQSSATANQAGLHVSPTDATAGNQLVVSSGAVYAGGVILGYAVGAPCFAAIKTDLRYLAEAEREAAAKDLLALRPVAFRYKGSTQERRGYVYEETPESLRDGKGAVVVDERLVNLELVLQAVQGQIRTLEGELGRLEGRRK